MRKIIFTTSIDNKEYSLYLSDEEDFLRNCLKKRIPAVALLPAATEQSSADSFFCPEEGDYAGKKNCSDLGFFPWAAEDETSLSDDEAYMKDVIYRTCGLPKTVCITQRLHIRELCENDASVISGLFAEGAESGFVSPWRSSPEETAAELREYNRYYYDMYGYGYFGIELIGPASPDASSGRLIGIAGFSGISDVSITNKSKDRRLNRYLIKRSISVTDPSPLEAGYLISAPYRRQGYAYEAMSALLGCSFTKTHDIYIFTDKKNIPGTALANKLTCS